ncbi:MAG: hypothetical protein WD250_15460 [Egibacteraceae bacterium]
MRTTLTLDPDVARMLKGAMHQRQQPMKRIVNDALRQALGPPPAAREPFRVRPHVAHPRPGIDLGGLNRLADELEDESAAADNRR